jgi:hypothetical protein
MRRKRKSVGRPVEVPNRVQLKVYVTAGEGRRIVRAAEQAGLSTSAFVRAAVVASLP